MLFRLGVLLVIMLIVVGADQSIKRYVLKTIGLGNQKNFRKVRLYVMKNKGALGGVGKTKPWLVLVLSLLLIAAVIAYCLLAEDGGFYVAMLAVMCAGGLSNAIDRLRYGGVIDYWAIRFKRKTLVVNLADVMIFAGAVLYIVARFTVK